LDQFVEYCLTKNPHIRFIIHTNGGLGSRELWQKLGKLLSNNGHQVKVSIDGLEDTNHLYRRGVVWSKLLENMRSFIDSGGRPYWKYIIFDHNAHQKDQAYALSKELGFYKFEERLPYGDPSGHIDAPNSSSLPSDLQTDFKKTSDIELTEDVFQGINETQIDCKVLAQPSLYFDHDQRVWPCCWLAQDGDHRTRTKKRELFFRKVFDRGIPQNFNDLKENSLVEILSHPFYEDLLPNSWSTKAIAKKECFSTCLSTCPKKS
jgi:sulfatase maturation enzyme AslB (radical SAM superfamily)